MGLIQRPVKHLGTRTYQTEVAIDPNDPILDDEVDGDLDTIYAEFNGNIDTTNIDPVGLSGTVIQDAPNGISQAQMNVGAAVAAKAAALANTVTATAGAGPQTLVSVPITTRGGTVLLISGTGGHYVMGGGTPTAIVRFTVLRDAAPLVPQPIVMDYALSGLGAEFLSGTLSAPGGIDTPAPGAHTYSVTVEVIGAGGSLTFATSGDPTKTGSYSAVELS